MVVQPAPDASLDRQLALIYGPIAEDLQKAEQILREELRSRVAFVEELTSRVQLYRGKRLRPALVLLVAKACGGVRPAHLTLAAVVEMIHAATLVHDDILDDADLRRHVTTVNAEWGNEASVLLGDFLFTHAFHLAAQLESTAGCRMIGKATNRVCEGELHQISRRGAFELTEEEYIDIIDGKTAELIACCCQIGAHFAGMPAKMETALTAYGRSLGIAFQISDDLLDLVSTEKATGKSLGSDLEKQKPTLPIIRFRQTADRATVDAFRQLFEQPGNGHREAILAYLARTDAISYSEQRAREHAEFAASQLDGLPDSPSKEILFRMAQFVVDRTG